MIVYSFARRSSYVAGATVLVMAALACSAQPLSTSAATNNHGGVSTIGGSLEDAAAAAYAKYGTQCESGADDSLSFILQYYRELDFAPGVSETFKSTALACIPKLATTCSANIEGCEGIGNIVGTLPTGSSCRRGLQCQSGVCKTGLSYGCGVCTAGVVEGGSCLKQTGTSYTTSSQECAPGLRCSFQSGTDTITATCDQIVVAAAGGSCLDGQRCPAGTECARASGGTRATCKPLAAPGSSCADGERCDLGGTYGCDTATKLCALLPKAGSSCSVSQCAHGLVCDGINKLCRAPNPAVQIASACSRGDTCQGAARCRSSSDGKTKTCVANLGLGQACGGTSIAACDTGMACDYPEGSTGFGGTCVKTVTAADCK